MPEEMSSEIELLKACVKGDTAAFEAIVKKYQSLICAITFGATGDVEKSEELAQETFINAWKSLSQLKDLSRFRAWITIIARNIVRNFFRNQKRDIVTKASPIEQAEDAEIRHIEPMETMITTEQKEVVRQALQQLPLKYSEPLVLFYRQEQSIRKVAEQLELSEMTVRTRLSRGRKLLKEQVAAMVETTIKHTGPGKAFTAAVVTSIGALAIKGSGVAAAAGISGAATVAASYSTAATIMSSITAKIITAAAVVAIGVGSVVVYKHIAKSGCTRGSYEVLNTVQKQENGQKARSADLNKKLQEARLVNNPSEETGYFQAEGGREAVFPPPRTVNDKIVADSNQPKTRTGISGIVIDKSTSKPIKGAEVFDATVESRHSTITDSNGHFELPGMKLVWRGRIVVIAKDYATRTIVLQGIEGIEDKAYQDLKIELGSGSKVAGTVSEPNGKPVAGATVKTFFFTSRPVITGEDGRFEIDGLDPAFGEYQLEAAHPDYPSSNVRFSPLPAGQTAIADIVLKPGITVYGQVTNTKGEPIGNVAVGNTTSPLMWNCISTKTDAGGMYKLKNVPAGEFVLWAVTDKYAPYVDRFFLDSAQPVKLLNIQLDDSCPLRGRIVDAQGNPVPGVNVGLREYKEVFNLSDDRVTSDSNGRFTMFNTPSQGKVILEFYASFIASAMPELEAGQEQEYVITIDRAGRIYGKVLKDKTGEPIRKFNVKMGFSKKVTTHTGGYSVTWSNQGHEFDTPKGTFDTGMENIPLGAQYAITVTADGFDSLTIDPVAVQQISKEPNRTEFRLKPATVIAGRVVDSNGLPIAGATIRRLTENNTLEHWDPRDLTTTNSKGEFTLSGVDSGKDGLYVAREAFAPYLDLAANLPRNSENSVEIVLVPGAEVFGRVVAPNGQGIPGARVTAHIFSEQLQQIVNSPYPNLKETVADANGYYKILDLPADTVSISVNSSAVSGNRNIAQKKITLESGQSFELNFGDEPGFVVTGAVRIGQKLLEMASVQIQFPDGSIKWGQTDSNGQFIIKGVPEGTYRVSTTCSSGFDTKTHQWRPGQEFFDSRQVSIEDNTNLDIDFGDGSASGKIPDQFIGKDKLQITTRRFTGRQIRNGIQRSWEYVAQAGIDPDGNFECVNLRAGRYYLVMTVNNETVAVSDVFELIQSQRLENVTFSTGTGKLQIHITDAETGQGISRASFMVRNEMETIFYSKKLAPQGIEMTADDQGDAEYSNLPKGKYCVWVSSAGYLARESDLFEVTDGKVTSAAVFLEPAAIIRFELSDGIKQRITAEAAYLCCRVTNLDTNELVPMRSAFYRFDEHIIYLDDAHNLNSRISGITLPAGRYKIEYRLYQGKRGYITYSIRLAMLNGSETIELAKREVKLITLSQKD